MSTLWQRRCTIQDVRDLIALAPRGEDLNDAQREALATRLRSVPTLEARRLDAWTIEHGGHAGRGFRWSAPTARRSLATAALQRRTPGPWTAEAAVRDVVSDQLSVSVRGTARPGSLSAWLASLDSVALGLVIAEATNWAWQLLEVAELCEGRATLCPSDAYFHVAGAQTTLRARRDFVIATETGRVVIRVRSGQPGKSAGPGLRTDLLADALADPNGHSADRMIGLWPEAGIALAVDGTVENLRAGARDVVRAAVVHRRNRLVKAA
jgi:hypothetical protein